jgi:hypothetical protein
MGHMRMKEAPGWRRPLRFGWHPRNLAHPIILSSLKHSKCYCSMTHVLYIPPQVGYLEQTAVGGSRRTVWQEARSRMSGLVAAERAIASAERELAAGAAGLGQGGPGGLAVRSTP